MTSTRELGSDAHELVRGLILASQGSGPLLQRDYWAVIEESEKSATEIAEMLAVDFCQFAPEDLVEFKRTDGRDEPLVPGVELEVQIRLAGACKVRVIHRDENSLTVATLEGHPEAGKITFGAYPNEHGDVIFHIRSKARSSSSVRYAGFLAVGEPMQTNTWTDYVDRVAHTVGDGVIGKIHAETTEIEDELDDPETICSPTYKAIGD